MKIQNYPLICWPLAGDRVLGHLLGTEHRFLAPKVGQLRGQFQTFIQKELREDDLFFFDLKDYQISHFTVEVRPAYHVEEKVYPTKDLQGVKVYVVHGPNEQGFFEAVFPELERSFFYYQKSDFDKLALHFARQALSRYTPDQVAQLFLAREPFLEILPVKLPPRKKRGTAGEALPPGPTLAKVADALPKPGRQGRGWQPDTAWERGDVVERLVHQVTQHGRNLVLVGGPGVGKSAIWNEMIRQLAPKQGQDKPQKRITFWRSNPLRIMAPARYLGEWQMICENLVEELESVNGYLWVEDFPNLLSTGGEGAEDSLGAFLRSFLQAGRLRLIGEMTPEQVSTLQRKLPGFLDLFELITVTEMEPGQTRRIGGYLSDLLQQRYGHGFTPAALDRSYDLLERFLRYERFPGKLVRFLTRCGQQLEQEPRPLDVPDVIHAFSQQTGLPEILLRDDLLLSAEEVRAFFAQRIRGQDHVIERLVNLVQVFKTGLNDPGKPLASLMFAGPTGVGKTATARALADFFFGLGQSRLPLLRLDMSEFQYPGQIHRLIGPSGKLVEHVRENPFGVVLFDEVEKAHPLIFDALLMVLDEGILMDAMGRITDFRNSILIMTSNLGAQQRKSLGFQPQPHNTYEADMRAFFRPEFVNRLDQIVPFQALGSETIREIADLELGAIARREGLQQRGLQMHFTPRLREQVAEQGFDPQYGARPLQRYIEVHVVVPLARWLLAHPEPQGVTLELDLVEGELAVKVH